MNNLYYETTYPFIAEQARNNKQNHIDQLNEVIKSAKALKDFLDSTDNIQPMYRGVASGEYSIILAEYFKNHNM